MYRAPNEPVAYNNQPYQPAPYENNYQLRNQPAPLPPVTQQTYQEERYVERREEPVVYHSNHEVQRTSPIESHHRTNELKRSNVRESRYNEYQKRKAEYKYNFFSMIDEPWNRCCEVGKCGTCPGNECVARR